MHPVLLKIGPITIYSYGLMLAMGFLVGIYLARLEAERVGIPKETVLDLGLYIPISSIVGARVLYVLLNLNLFSSYPHRIVFLNEGGFVFYGGLILAGLIGLWYVKRERLPFFKIADIIAPSIAIGYSIARIGCLLYGCCYGRPTSLCWGMSFGVSSPADQHYSLLPLHPTQIYSSLTNLLIYIILVLRRPKARFEGEIFLLYLMLYSPTRFMIEHLRGDNPELLLSSTISQAVSLIIGSAAVIVYLLKREKSAAGP